MYNFHEKTNLDEFWQNIRVLIDLIVYNKSHNQKPTLKNYCISAATIKLAIYAANLKKMEQVI